jgi:iron(III) transport system substrate-binding protein
MAATSCRARERACMVALAIVAAASCQASSWAAAPDSVEAIANYIGADRQQILEDGARREANLLLYTTGTQIQPLLDRFEQKYPYVKIELARGSAADTARKVLEEYRAGYDNVDAFELASNGLMVARDENILQPFQSPEMAAYNPDSIEAARNWIVVRESYTGIGFNTNLIPPDSAPKTYADLTDPQWKGRMALSALPSTVANWVGAMVVVHGADFVRKFSSQNVRLYNITGRALANLMLTGEVALSPTIYNSHVAASREKGEPLGWNAPGPVPVTDTCAALARKAPHPHAAMLLIDFLLSKEGQELYRTVGYDSARTDMNSATPVQKLYLSNRPNYMAEFDSWVKLYQEVFVRRKI